MQVQRSIEAYYALDLEDKDILTKYITFKTGIYCLRINIYETACFFFNRSMCVKRTLNLFVLKPGLYIKDLIPIKNYKKMHTTIAN